MPAQPPHPPPLKQFQLVLSSALTPQNMAPGWAAHVWRWDRARQVMGQEWNWRLKFEDSHGKAGNVLNVRSLLNDNSRIIQTLKISTQRGKQRTLCSPTLLRDCRNDLYSGSVQWTVSLGYGEPCTTHCPHYAPQWLRLSCPCSAATLLHVSELLCHTNKDE